MIEWPDERGIPDEGREGLRLFRTSGAAVELASKRERWRVVSWPWTDELPVRVVLSNEQGDDLVFECDSPTNWRLVIAPMDPHPPSAADIARDRAAIPEGSPPDVRE